MRHKLAALTFAALLFAAGISTGYGQEPAQPSAADQVEAPAGTKVVRIDDPVLGLNFFTTTFPEDWVFLRKITRGTPCVAGTTPFYRASSPDGLSGDKMFPRFDSGWSNNPIYTPQGNSGCLAREGEIRAADFLKHMVSLLHVEYDKDLTDAAVVEQLRNNWARLSSPGLGTILRMRPPLEPNSISTVFGSKKR